MNVKALQEHTKELRTAQGWQDTSVERRVIFLMSEVGELSKEILKLSATATDTNPEQVKEQLGMEMYDVIWNICDLANLVGVDLEAAFAKKIALNQKRRW